MRLLPLFAPALLATLLLSTGCAPGLAPAERAALDRAAIELDRQLTPAGQLAATAAMIYERGGAYPATPFDLLGSPEAAASGARQLSLSNLTLRPEGDGLRIEYTLLPRRDDPTDRMGSLLVRQTEEGRYVSEVALTRRDDPDHTGRPLDIAEEDPVAVRRLDGRFAIDLPTVMLQAEAGPAGDLPLTDEPYTITFTPSPGFAAGAPEELRRGYTVTIGA
jgi:hypothetical protein